MPLVKFSPQGLIELCCYNKSYLTKLSSTSTLFSCPQISLHAMFTSRKGGEILYPYCTLLYIFCSVTFIIFFFLGFCRLINETWTVTCAPTIDQDSPMPWQYGSHSIPPFQTHFRYFYGPLGERFCGERFVHLFHQQFHPYP